MNCPKSISFSYAVLELNIIARIKMIIHRITVTDFIEKMTEDLKFDYSGTSLILLNGETCKIYEVPITG